MTAIPRVNSEEYFRNATAVECYFLISVLQQPREICSSIMVSACHSKLWQHHCKGGKVPGVLATCIFVAGTEIKPSTSPVILPLPRHVCIQRVPG